MMPEEFGRNDGAYRTTTRRLVVTERVVRE
jgi:hypothetical protein